MNMRRFLDQSFIVVTLLLMSSAFISHLVDLSTADSSSGGSAKMQMIWATVYLITLVRIAPHWRKIFYLMRGNLAFTLFASLAIVSALWSANSALTLRHGMAFLFSTLFGFDLARRYTLHEQLSLLAKMLFLAIGLSCLVETIFPSFAIRATFGETGLIDNDESWIGIYHQKNILGHVVALAAVLVLTKFRLRLQNLCVCVPILIFCLFVIQRARSQTAFVVVFSTAYLLAGLLLFRLRRRMLTTLGVAAGLVAGSLSLLAFSNRDALLNLLGRDSNLTGRTGVWDLVFQSIAEKPFLGYGFSAFWQVSYQSKRIDQLLNWTVPSSHNMYIDIALQVGILGLGLFLVSYFTAIKRSVSALRLHSDPAVLWPVAYLMLSMVYGFSESDLYSANSLYWVLLTSACVSASLYAEPVAHARSERGVAFGRSTKAHTQTANAVQGS